MSLCMVLLVVGLLVFMARSGKPSKGGDSPPDQKHDPLQNTPIMQEMMAENMKGADRELFIRCCRYMELRKPFLVESFSLEDLSLAMFTNKLYLSQTINACTGRNFRNFVNNYRIMYAMDLFKKNNRLRVSDLSNLSGFHTPVSFNMAFKLMMDESPGAWCARTRLRNQRKTK